MIVSEVREFEKVSAKQTNPGRDFARQENPTYGLAKRIKKPYLRLARKSQI
jgi:hypothetical protein